MRIWLVWMKFWSRKRAVALLSTIAAVFVMRFCPFNVISIRKCEEWDFILWMVDIVHEIESYLDIENTGVSAGVCVAAGRDTRTKNLHLKQGWQVPHPGIG